ncbi:MAG: hypothetical protein Gyms2KO_03410 [Gymnodinialimonas sp.]
MLAVATASFWNWRQDIAENYAQAARELEAINTRIRQTEFALQDQPNEEVPHRDVPSMRPSDAFGLLQERLTEAAISSGVSLRSLSDQGVTSWNGIDLALARLEVEAPFDDVLNMLIEIEQSDVPIVLRHSALRHVPNTASEERFPRVLLQYEIGVPFRLEGVQE